MPGTARPLGAYLRARRALISPAQAGLHPGGTRQVPGLRREEVAVLAGLSTDYYIQLEQGRERHPSLQVVNALAGALQLDPDGHHHLCALAGHHPLAPGTGDAAEPDRRLLTELIRGWAGTPAMVVTRRLDVLARNELADLLYDDLPHRDNLARMTFYDARARTFVEDWWQLAHCTVGTLRSGAVPSARVPGLDTLVAELAERSEEFRRLWARHDVHRKGSARKLFHHARTGPLRLHQHVMTLPNHLDVQVWIYQAEPGSEAETRLDLLRHRIRPANDASTPFPNTIP